MRICSNHPEYPVPLIWTFAFRGAEFWCPFCGYVHGMFGAGEDVEETPELTERLEKYKVFSSDFLHATGVQICVSTEYEGIRMKPDELPDAEKQRLKNIRDKWKYNIKIEA